MSKRAAERRKAAARLQVLSLILLGAALVLCVVRRDVSDEAYPNLVLVALVAGAFFLLITSVFVAGQWPSSIRTTDPAIIALTLLAVGSITWAQDTRSAVVHSAEIVGTAMVFLITRWTVQSRARQRALIAVLLSTAAVAVLYGYHQYAVEFDELLKLIRERPEAVTELSRVNSMMVPDLRERIQSREVYSFFLISNVFAGYLLPFIGAMAGAAFGLWRKRRRLGLALWLLALGATCGIFALTKSKGAFAAVGVTLLGIACWRVWSRCPRLRPILLTLAVVCVVGAVVACVGFVNWDALGMHGGSAGVRLGFWEGASSVFVHHPLLGVGAGGFGDFYFTYKPDWAHEVQTAHSVLFQTLAEFGALGTGLALVFVLSWIYEVLGRSRRKEVGDESGSDEILLMGLSGPAALGILGVAFQAESALAITAFVIIWCLSYGLIVKALGQLDSRGGIGPIEAGLGIGLVALALHSLIDFDLEVQGVAMTAAAIAGLLVGQGRRQTRPETRRLSVGKRWILLIVSGAAFIAFVATVVAPIGRAESLLWQSRQESLKGRIGRAFALAEESVRVDPRYTDGYVTLAELAILKGEAAGDKGGTTPEAVADLRKAIATDPQNSTLRRRLAELYARNTDRPGYADEAIRLYKEALERYPSDTQSLRGLGELYERLAESGTGKRREYLSDALACYERFLSITEKTTERRMELTPAEKDEMQRKVEELKESLADG